MIKVCHITNVHPKEDVRIFHKECVSLANAGYDVTLVQQGDSYDKNGVHLAGFGSVATNRLKRMLLTARAAYKKALEVDADVYHLHDPELLPFGLKLKRKGKKVIFDSHECYREQIRCRHYLPAWLLRFISSCYGAYEDFILRRLDAVVFPCTMNGVNPFEGHCKRAAIISNAAILGELFDRYDSAHEKLPDSVCYVGGLTEARGITNNILAAAKANASLHLAGAFSSGKYEAQVRQMPEFSHVEFHGMLNRTGITELLASTRIGLCTLLDRGQYLKIDTFGIKVFEYMSMGLPVILSDTPFNRKMTDTYGFGLCADQDDPDAIAKAIRYLLDNPEDAARMGENGRRAVKEEFNWSVEEKKLVALYEDILKE